MSSRKHLTLTLVAGAFALIAVSARAAQPAYRIVSVATGKCLALSSSSSGNGVNIHQWQCSGVHNEANLLWTLHPASPVGFTQIRNVGTGKCIALKSSSNANGVNIHQWQCQNVHEPDNLLWNISSANNAGDAKLRSKQSGKCVALKQHSGNNGVNIHQWQCQNVNNENYLLWSLQ